MTRSTPLPRQSITTALLQSALLAYGVGAVLHRVHGGGDLGLPWLVHWLRDSTLAMPLAAVVVVVAAAGSGHLQRRGRLEPGSASARLTSAVCTALLYSSAVIPAGLVHGAAFSEVSAHGGGLMETALLNASVAFVTGLPLLLLAHSWTAVAACWPSRRSRRSLASVIAAAAVVLTAAPAPAAVPADPAWQAEVASCGPGTASRSYDVAAINVHIPYNRWGDGDPHGMVYVLQGDKLAVRDWDKPLDPAAGASSNRRLRPRPLVLRANEGECVAVNLTNELTGGGEGLPQAPYASMAVLGVPFDVQSSGGSHAGYNDDTTLAPGASRTQYWRAPQEGTYFFHDTATPAGAEANGGSVAHGLFGAFIVEPAGSTWRDPRTGDLLYTETLSQSGDLYLDALITPPTGRAFRETVQLAQDEMPVTSGFGFNYGSEPESHRDARRCPDCIGEETSLSSWAHGDPALVKLASGRGPWLPGAADPEDCGLGAPGYDAESCFTSNVTHAYAGDPIKFRYGMAGGRETHVFHMHAHTWLVDEGNVGAAGSNPSRPGPGAEATGTTIDSQTFGPNEMFTANLLFGAGSSPGTVGDTIFHCHLYPHFADGFWALMRVHDVREDGTGRTPDGIAVSAVQPLPNASSPPLPTAEHPGYPRFIPGTYGHRAPQPPMGILQAGVPATRFVAGRPLEGSTDPVTVAALAREQAAMSRLSGGRSKPGAPFRDPCPSGSREVTYKVSAIQRDVVYNERGDHDTQARILVRDEDVEDVLAGRKPAEPLFTRANVGDCVIWELTNRLPNWFGNDAFQKLVQTNMFGEHVHLVKFDVLASDGSSNGWNYQQAAFSSAQTAFNEGIAADPGRCTATSCRIPTPASWDPRTTSAGLAPGQTYVGRWYADYELRTAFTHDHHFAAIDQARGQYGALVVQPAGMDFRDPRTGAYLQPVNTTGRAGAPPCGTACEGTAVGTKLDVIGPGPDDDFRDFGLAIADFVSLTRAGGDPAVREDVINPPPAPEQFPSEDPGVMAVNYRNAPLDARRTKNGQAVDPAYAFSSTVFGDPQTPVLQTYAGDNVRIRLIQGAHEEEHQVLVHGQKWRKEPNDPGSPMIDGAVLGVSEAFNFEVPRLNCAVGEDCRGDYLYSGSSVDEMAYGVWGILRVHGGRVPGLLPLPDNVPQGVGSVPSRSPDALAPPAATTPGTPCAPGAPVRTYDVVAMQAKITYNDAGDHDPYGLVYALASDEAAIRAGKNPEPLVLRASEGDCLEVTLTNKLTPAFQEHAGPADGDPLAPPENRERRVAGLRVSMHPGMLKYDVRGSDGAAVGFNPDSTVAPGSSRTYRWSADEVSPGEIGGAPLSDFGDVLGHRHHGLTAGIVVEPKGATWHDPVTGAPGTSRPNADIRVPGRPDFRESVVFVQDGLNLRDASGAHIGDRMDAHPPEPGQVFSIRDGLDVEDRGQKAYGYRNEPFRHRLGFEPVDHPAPDGAAMAAVYDSDAHGDPATSIMRAYAGDPLRVRVLGTGVKPRQHSFGLDGHGFKPQPDDPHGRTVGTLSGITVGSSVNAEMGAAGPVGDYLYGTANRGFHRSAGLWGLLRTYRPPASSTELQPTAIPARDDPRAGGHPLLPLELDVVEAHVFDDLDRNGTRDPGEPPVAGAVVSGSVDGAVLSRATSGSDGVAHVQLRPGTYRVEASAAGRRPVTGPAQVTTNGDNDLERVLVPLTTAAPPSGGGGGGGGGEGGAPPAGGGGSHGAPPPTGGGGDPGSPPSGQAAGASPTPSASPSFSAATASPSPSPAPAGSPTPASCSTPATLALERTVITAGEAAGIVLRAAPGSAVQLHAYTRPSTAYRLVRTGRTGTDGTVRFDVRPHGNTRLVAQSVDCPRGPSVVLAVRTAHSLSVSRQTTLTYAFRGRALPARPGGLVISLYRIAGARYVLTSQARADSKGIWQLSRRFTGRGTHDFVVRTGADMTSAAGTSPVRRIRLH